MRPKSRTLLAALLLAAVAHALFATGVAAQGLTDTLSHQPPLTGPEPYSPGGIWLPGTGGFPAPGKTYVDPVFGTTIRRLTGMWPNPGDAALYAKNGFWNADGTRLAYSHSDTGTIHVTDTTTGQDVASGLPGYGSSEVNFDPNFPDVWYYGSGTQLRKYLLSTGGTVVVKDFGQGIANLGGTGDMVDNSGRYFVVNLSGQAFVWDGIDANGRLPGDPAYVPQAAGSSGLLSGSFSASFGGGYVTMAPDGSGVEMIAGASVTWSPISRTAGTFGPAVSRGSVEGDHGDILSASDGNTYHIYDLTSPGLRIMKTNLTRGGASQVLDLSALSVWDDLHFSCISRGANRDWCVFATETNLLSDLGSWSPWHQEIIMVNVVTGAFKRLAHHRSREINDYMRSPRVSANRDGTKIAYASSYGYDVNSYSDIFAIELGGSSPGPLPALTSVAPAHLVAGAASLVLTVTGSNFGPTSVVQWNGANRTTTFVSSTHLQAAVPAADVATPGAAQVTVVNPPPGGGTSVAQSVTISVAMVDLGVYRASTTKWYILRASDGSVQQVQWGAAGDVPVFGDFDGDGKADLAVFRPSNGTWYVLRSSDGTLQQTQWGAAGDVPVPRDYDGDGKADLAVFRPSTGIWYVLRSRDGSVQQAPWGLAGDQPVPADYDGDGKADLAVFRPSNGTWYVLRSSDGKLQQTQWGGAGDTPIPSDYDGAGKANLAVFRPTNGTWYILRSTGTLGQVVWGAVGDQPLAP